MSIFHANGFDFKEDEGQVLLTAVPFSKDTILGVEDVQELLHLIMSGSPAAFQMGTQSLSSGRDPSEQAAKVVRPSRYTSQYTVIPETDVPPMTDDVCIRSFQ